MPRSQASLPGRRKNSACHRCRKQKIRCDNDQPCRNCTKAGHQCVRLRVYSTIEPPGGSEQRLQMLQESLRRLDPRELDRILHLTCSESLSQDTVPLNRQPPRSGPHNPEQPVGEEAAANATNNSFGGVGGGDTAVYRPAPSPTRMLVRNGATTRSSYEKTDDYTRIDPELSTQIRPNEPLAHNVGLLSLANSHDPKYLGPSSGVSFARQFLSAISQSQGSAASLETPESGGASRSFQRPDPFPSDWPFEVDPRHFVEAYLETYQPFYPFLDGAAVVHELDTLWPTDVSRLHSTQQSPTMADLEKLPSPMISAQILFVAALGAKVLETKLSTAFHSERYLATAMAGINALCLHDNVQGIQIMLLLVLCGLSFADGPSPWLLTSNAIAACLDLGFQRKWTTDGPASSSSQDSGPSNDVRGGIFWSAYSLERSLAVVLGRPLTLRDEAIDVEFPGAGDSSDITFKAGQYSFQFDQLTAEIKLMLYRVRRAPNRFPWLSDSDTSTWRQEAHQHITALAESMVKDLQPEHQPRFDSTRDSHLRLLELKYHQCLLLLHRPSPGEPTPSLSSWQVCSTSAAGVLHVTAELTRLARLPDTWLMAHTVFVSGITFLHCLWTKEQIRRGTPYKEYNAAVEACKGTLRSLGRTWEVAVDALGKFERLVELTSETWRAQMKDAETEAGAEAGQCLMGGVPGHQDGNSGTQDVQIEAVGRTDVEMLFEGEQELELEPLFYSELGDMSSCFDLDWIFTSTT